MFGWEYAYAFGRDEKSEEPGWVEKIRELKESIVKAKGGSSSSKWRQLYNDQVALTQALQVESERKQAQEDEIIEGDENYGDGTLLTGSQGAVVNAKNKKSTTLLGA